MLKFAATTIGSAFTLIEVLVVIVIITGLAALLMPAITATQEGADRMQTEDLVTGLQMAMTIYKLDGKGYPSPDNPQDPTVGQPGNLIGNFILLQFLI